MLWPHEIPHLRSFTLIVQPDITHSLDSIKTSVLGISAFNAAIFSASTAGASFIFSSSMIAARQ